MIKILAFGIVAEKIKSSEFYLEDVENTQLLRDLLRTRFPELAGTKYSVSINRKLVHEDVSIDSGSEVALLPPFSGG